MFSQLSSKGACIVSAILTPLVLFFSSFAEHLSLSPSHALVSLSVATETSVNSESNNTRASCLMSLLSLHNSTRAVYIITFSPKDKRTFSSLSVSGRTLSHSVSSMPSFDTWTLHLATLFLNLLGHKLRWWTFRHCRRHTCSHFYNLLNCALLSSTCKSSLLSIFFLSSFVLNCEHSSLQCPLAQYLHFVDLPLPGTFTVSLALKAVTGTSL